MADLLLLAHASQLAQVVGEVRKTRYANRLSVVTLAGRKQLCTNDDVRGLGGSSISEACLDLQARGGARRRRRLSVHRLVAVRTATMGLRLDHHRPKRKARLPVHLSTAVQATRGRPPTSRSQTGCCSSRSTSRSSPPRASRRAAARPRHALRRAGRRDPAAVDASLLPTTAERRRPRGRASNDRSSSSTRRTI